MPSSHPLSLGSGRHSDHLARARGGGVKSLLVRAIASPHARNAAVHLAAPKYGRCRLSTAWAAVGRHGRSVRGYNSLPRSFRGTSLGQGRVMETREGLFRAPSWELPWMRGAWGVKERVLLPSLRGVTQVQGNMVHAFLSSSGGSP